MPTHAYLCSEFSVVAAAVGGAPGKFYATSLEEGGSAAKVELSVGGKLGVLCPPTLSQLQTSLALASNCGPAFKGVEGNHSLEVLSWRNQCKKASH